MLLGLLERSRIAKKIAEYEEALALPPFPQALRYIWVAFWRLRRRKGGSGFGPSPIEWADIDAFLRHTRLPLVPWEIEMIETLDDLYMAQQARAAGTDRD